MDVRVGTDIVAVERLASLLGERGDDFARRWFTDDEIAYCRAKAKPVLHFAARLAAKEAVAKALGSPWAGPLPWHDIEVTLDDHGAPGVRLSGEAEQLAGSLGADAIRVSLSHAEEYATATAVFLLP